ncbi:MAG TPA: ABC transporter permease [Terriglobales bacterium]|nr:ABC transporter permease [Terriglobales bacterium]
METLFQDIRYATRMLRKSPGFTTVAVITLALGIGANTAIFTIVNALLLKMLPVSDPEQLVVVGDPSTPNSRSNGTPRVDIFSYPLYKELRDHNSVFTGLCAAGTDHRIEVDTGHGESSPEKVIGRMVSGNYFSVLGLNPAAGRLLSDSDDTAEDANPVVVLGYGFWQRKFATSPSVIGTDIRLNGFPFTVIGVAPPGFTGDVVGEQMALFVPLSMQPEIVRGRHWRNAVNTSWLTLFGRLKSGMTAAQSAANLNIVFQQAVKGTYGAALSTDDRNAIRDLHMKIEVVPGGTGVSGLRRDYKLPLLLLMGIVGLVLLIACVNVANLLLARATARRREIAVRLAVGANWGRLLRQLLTESVLLAFLGGIAGSLLAIWGVRLLVTIFGSDTTLPVRPDVRVLVFTISISLFTGLLFGLIPALRAMRVQVSPALKESGRSTPERSSRFGLGKGLIAGQVALSLLVLFAASLLVRSLQKLMAQDFGYDRDRLVIARIDPISTGYDSARMKLLATQLVMRVASTPGVHAVTYSTNGLFAGTESDDAIIVPGFNGSHQDREAAEDYVGPEYFGAVGIPILAGRGIEQQDTATSTRVAVVNEAMVKYFFAGQNPIGREFRIDDADWLDKPITIVGISRDAKDHSDGIREAVKPRFYMAFQQVPSPVQIVLEAQVQGVPSAAVTNVTSQIRAVDPNLPVSFVKTLDTLVSDAAANQTALARLSVFFGVLALLLACVGLYGVMSYTVAGRSREIGVRMALGAAGRDVVQMLLREGMLLVLVGVAVGIPLALVSSQVLRSFLFGLKATDPVSLIGVILLLGAIAALAAFIPARRGSKIDPMVALRYE